MEELQLVARVSTASEEQCEGKVGVMGVGGHVLVCIGTSQPIPVSPLGGA